MCCDTWYDREEGATERDGRRMGEVGGTRKRERERERRMNA